MLVRTLLTLAGLTLLLPAAASAQGCSAEVVQQTLVSAGQLSQEQIDGGVVVEPVRCGDVTGDGSSDAVYALASGGTAGDTRFGVLAGSADGTLGRRIFVKSGYQVGIARYSRTSFDVLQPFFKSTDGNCCPSSFRQTRYTWNGSTFNAAHARKLGKAPGRFYRP